MIKSCLFNHFCYSINNKNQKHKSINVKIENISIIVKSAIQKQLAKKMQNNNIKDNMLQLTHLNLSTKFKF